MKKETERVNFGLVKKDYAELREVCREHAVSMTFFIRIAVNILKRILKLKKGGYDEIVLTARKSATGEITRLEIMLPFPD